MIFQQIQHTTLLLHFAGKTLLIDPVLNSGAQTSLSVPMREILQADAVIITSTHPEHFDETAKNVLPKSIPVFVPDVMALESLKSAGFTNITIMEKETPLDNIAFSRTPLSGNPAGVLIEHPSEKTLFVTGDSVWNDGFLDAVHTLQPRAIAINFGISSAQNAAAFGKESLSKIWDRFYKIDASRGKDRKGTGLGLAIVKEIINAHKQNINVISTVGVGTEFIFTLEKAK